MERLENINFPPVESIEELEKLWTESMNSVEAMEAYKQAARDASKKAKNRRKQL